MRLAICIILTTLAVCACGGKGGSGADRRAAASEKPFTETGELRAASSATLPMPWFHWDYGQPQITFLEKEGTVVRPGDVVATIETSGLLKVLENKKAELAMAQADLNKLKVDQQTALEKLQTERINALAALKAAGIDSQRVRFESRSRQEVMRLELAKSRIALSKIERRIEAVRKIQEQELTIQNVKMDQIRIGIEAAQRAEENFTLRSPAAGMIVYGIKDRRQRTKVQVGDQLWPGDAIINLPDLSQMKVLTTVNETDIRKVAEGQKVTVSLDAYPDMSFHGRITTISHTCQRKDRNSRIKVFDVEVLLDGTHRILKPGMTVSCKFLLSR